MQRITVPDSLVDKLKNSNCVLEVCDPAGKVLGRIFPAGILGDICDFEETDLDNPQGGPTAECDECFTIEEGRVQKREPPG